MSDDLINKANVAIDLLAKGADIVEITDTGLKIERRNIENVIHTNSRFPTQIININTQAVNYTVNQLNNDLDDAYEFLKSVDSLQDSLSELRDKIQVLKDELPKEHPNKNRIKSILKWTLDKCWETFITLAPVIINSVNRPT